MREDDLLAVDADEDSADRPTVARVDNDRLGRDGLEPVHQVRVGRKSRVCC